MKRLLKVYPWRLIRGGVIDIDHVTVEGAELQIEYSRQRELNVTVVQEHLAGEETGGSAAAGNTPAEGTPTAEDADELAGKPNAPSQPPRILLREGTADVLVRYVYNAPRARQGGEPVELNLRQRLTLRRLEVGPDAASTADVMLTGGLEGQQEVFATDLQGTIDPIRDVGAMTFDLTGSVANVAAGFYQPYLDKEEIS